MKYAKSTSALFSQLKRRDFLLFLQLATGTPNSKLSVDPETGTLHKPMPFRQAFAHIYRLSKVFAAHLSLPPSTVVTSPEFKQFNGALCGGYVPACKRTIHKILCIIRTLIDEKIREMLEDARQHWGKQHVALQTDMWSCGGQHEAHSALLASFFISSFDLSNVLLEISAFPDITHSADILAEYLEGAMMRSGLSRSDVSVITTDGASNIVNACSHMQLQHQRCFAHSLKRCVMYGLGLADAETADLRLIGELMGRCKRLVTFVNSTTKTHKLLVEAGKQQSETFTALRQEVATRWISSYAMLESILKNQKILQCVFLDDSFEEKRQSLLPTVSEFRSIPLLCSLLAPCADATNLVEVETYITASLGHAVVRQL